MKFTEMPYQRPDIPALRQKIDALRARIEGASSAEEAERAYRDFDALSQAYGTETTLAYVRHTIDTRDEFYDAENTFADENNPAVQEMAQAVNLALLRSPFRSELEQRLGALLFTNLEIEVRSFDAKNLALMQEENRLQSEYQKLYASALVDWEGAKLPLPKLGPYKQSLDRSVRRQAYEAEGLWFDAHREELDRLYDALVQNRTQQARNLGHANYLPLGYDRLGRNCYGPKEVEAFRDQIAGDLVPIVNAVRAAQAKRLGLPGLTIYDSTISFPDGNAVPQGTAEEILAQGHEMYRELSPETAEFADFLWDNGLLDVLSKEGKAPGGYCTEMRLYGAPFIFSNFNGTSGDVDVLTHEAGHAFASYRAMRRGILSNLQTPTMEAAEVHSMSMEFLTAPWHVRFFGKNVRKYELAHCEDALTFIPYGCMVDEFQHRMYENPALRPEERNAVWLDLEKKYRPWQDMDGLPFYGRGAGWQRQLHIYLYPFYYIDYCMAQTVAFQFWMASLADRADAWQRYLRFVDGGGAKTFASLVADAGLQLPYAPGCIRQVGSGVAKWLSENAL
ncbi:MAG: M3 family oligoendopeptidase [Candidatus Spyradocola sp.]|jgi:M3 family oligoendopeptidase